jgi:hypothetical protein
VKQSEKIGVDRLDLLQNDPAIGDRKSNGIPAPDAQYCTNLAWDGGLILGGESARKHSNIVIQ